MATLDYSKIQEQVQAKYNTNKAMLSYNGSEITYTYTKTKPTKQHHSETVTKQLDNGYATIVRK